MSRFDARLQQALELLESDLTLNRQKRTIWQPHGPGGTYVPPVIADLSLNGEIIRLSAPLAARFGTEYAIDFETGNEWSSRDDGGNLWKYRIGKNGKSIGMAHNTELYVEPATGSVYARVSRNAAGHAPRTSDRGGLVIRRRGRVYVPVRLVDGEASNVILAKAMGDHGEIDWRPDETMPEDFYAA